MEYIIIGLLVLIIILVIFSISKNINVLEILKSKYLVVTEDAIADIEEALK